MLIPSEVRATVGAVKGLAVQLGMMSLFALIGGVAQTVSYRAAFVAVGGLVTTIGLGTLAAASVAARRRAP